MKKQAAIVVSLLFAVGTAGAAYAAEPTDGTSKSRQAANSVKKDDGSPTDTRPNTTTQPACTDDNKKMRDGKPCAPKVMEGANVVPEGGIPQAKVTGELVKIDGKNYVVKDEKGKEVRFMIDERTQMNANPVVGDKIRVKVEPQGYAYSVNMASDAPGSSLPDKQSDPLAKSDPKSIKK